MSRKKYILGRSIILYVTIADFLKTLLHGFDYRLGFDFLLLGNLISHVLAPIFFIGMGMIVYGLIVKKEYLDYKFSFLDLVVILLILLMSQDHWYTIVTPHPLFHDRYGI